jgi:transposase-like protein
MIKRREKKVKKASANQVFDYGEFEREAIAGLQSGKGLVGTEGVLTSIIQRLVNAALSGEMSQHLREKSETGESNRRNGKLSKQLTELGPINIETPRDRLGSFEPKLVGKWQRQLGAGLDSQILSLYAKGHCYSDMQHQLKTLYGLDYSTAWVQLRFVSQQTFYR